jgi:two-component system nitrogen regulation sensor histidine kinase NtrY
MTLRARLSAYLLALHLPLFGCAALLLPARPLWFLGCEAALLASLALGWRLVARALEPLAYTRRLHDLLQDRDYGHRLARPGKRESELNELVATFNTMLDALHRERLALGEQRGFLERLLAATPSAVLVFDFDGARVDQGDRAVALLGFAHPLGRPLAAWIDGGEFLPTLDGRARERARALARQLDALPVGAAQLLEDADGRRWRAQRGHFFDRGFVRDFLLVDELTVELDDSERAAYARLVRVLAHEVNNTLAATRSVLDSLLAYRGRLAEPDDGDFATANSSNVSARWSRCPSWRHVRPT